MKITFEASKFETGRAIALAHAMNAWRKEEELGLNSYWSAEEVLINFGRQGVYEKLEQYREYIFS